MGRNPPKSAEFLIIGKICRFVGSAPALTLRWICLLRGKVQLSLEELVAEKEMKFELKTCQMMPHERGEIRCDFAIVGRFLTRDYFILIM